MSSFNPEFRPWFLFRNRIYASCMLRLPVSQNFVSGCVRSSQKYAVCYRARYPAQQMPDISRHKWET